MKKKLNEQIRGMESRNDMEHIGNFFLNENMKNSIQSLIVNKYRKNHSYKRKSLILYDKNDYKNKLNFDINKSIQENMFDNIGAFINENKFIFE